MWEELGISSGTFILVLIALYFVIKWAVKNGIKEAYRGITENLHNEDRARDEGLKLFVKETDSQCEKNLNQENS